MPSLRLRFQKLTPLFPQGVCNEPSEGFASLTTGVRPCPCRSRPNQTDFSRPARISNQESEGCSSGYVLGDFLAATPLLSWEARAEWPMMGDSSLCTTRSISSLAKYCSETGRRLIVRRGKLSGVAVN